MKMKATEIRNLHGVVELVGGMLKTELEEILLQVAQLDNPVKIAEVKRDIARVKTIIREQQLAGR